MATNGRNPLRWKCDVDGCFNLKKRPKIEEFAECFPRRIGVSDVDGWVELNSRFLLLEWKPAPVELSTGQRIAFKRFSEQSYGNAVYCVAGDAETMEITHFAMFFNGQWHPWEPTTIDYLKAHFKRWADWIEKDMPKGGKVESLDEMLKVADTFPWGPEQHYEED